MNASPRLLHDLFTDAVRAHPDVAAIDVPPGRGRPQRTVVSYGELHRRARELACVLRPRVRPDDVVTILLPRDSERLYVAQLAVLMAGAAHSCLAPSFPDDFITSVLEDAEPRVVVTDTAGRRRVSGHADVIDLDVERPRPSDDPIAISTGADDLAYLIYTSGTTGRPKGVMIEHRGIVNLIESDLEEYGLGPGDRVAQGSSAAYDSAVEETWLALASGATLVLLDDETARLGPDIVPWLRDERITVFCPTPTMLRMTACADPSTELPALRLVYTGGEAIPQDLADAWARGRRLENGYGPTECTVTVVRTRLEVGRPVAIGKPVPGHVAHVLDEALAEVEEGAEGELCIAGPGVARGYLRRPEVTAERFVEHPEHGRLYRTGDLVRRDGEGDLFYLGRIDAQVKLRGYRIELGAVEARLAACEGVRTAACAVRGHDSARHLAAWIVADDRASPPDLEGLKAAVGESLPAYMVPSRIATLDALPTTVGGKLDRKALPEIESTAGTARLDGDDPVEHLVLEAFAGVLGVNGAAADSDFFVDLGGDSLSVVAVVCALREHDATASATTRDLYEARTARALAARLTSGATRADDRIARGRVELEARPGAAQVALVTALQGVVLAVGVTVAGAFAWWLLLVATPWLLGRIGVTGLLLGLPIAIAAARPLMVAPTVVLAALVKALLIGRYRPRAAPVWGWFWLRHWLCQRTMALVPWGALEGTVFHAAALRALGARIGKRVHIHRGVDLHNGGPDLLEIGDDVALGQDATLATCELEQGHALFDRIRVEDEATVEVRAAVSRGATVARRGCVTALSWLPHGEVLAAGRCGDGVPASDESAAAAPPEVDRDGDLAPALHGLLLMAARALSAAFSSVPLALALLAAAILWGVSAAEVAAWLVAPRWTSGGAATLAAAVVIGLPVSLFARALLVRALGNVPEGAVSRWSPAYIRIWLVTGEVEAAGRWLSGSLFWPAWLRLAGMRIGAKAEVSSIHDVVPGRVEIGGRSFFADGVYLGGPRVSRGTVVVGHTVVGRETFFGNHVVVPAGSRLPDEYFLGVSTVADDTVAARGTSWFGRPALELPRREIAPSDPRTTFDPTPGLYLTRLFWETMRFALPLVPLALLALWHLWVAASPPGTGMAVVAGAVAAAGAGAALATAAFVHALKWCLLGRVRPGTHPFWSGWCGRWDLVYMAWQIIARPVLVGLEGTLWLTFFLRAMGMRIGRRVVLAGGFAQVVDPDMLTFGDGATVGALFQAHSFEDRVLKIAPVNIEAGATVGHGTVVFYGVEVGRDAWVAPQGVVMKNDRLTAGADHVGAPSRRVGR